jgi:hypothetical protein
MGLDMYLYARKHFWRDEDKPKVNDIPEGYEPWSVDVKVLYWRKANAIHQWFVDNVQDGIDNCQEYYVRREQLESLRNLCIEVLDGAPPEDRLPTKSGFFFGSTEYDQGYRDDLHQTVIGIDRALTDFNDEWEFRYSSSW